MQLSKNSQLKDSILNWSISIFILLLISASLISHLFQNPKEKSYQYTSYSQLITQAELQHINVLQIHNSQGDVTLEKQTNGEWIIKEPRYLNAKQHTINSLLKSISQIHITKVFNKDPINLTNFALNTPRISLTLKDTTSPKPKIITLLFGMINPILHANYVTIKRKNIIYQTDMLDFPLDQLSFTDLIETKIFPFPIRKIKKIKIYKYEHLTLNLQHQGGDWLQQQKIISPSKITLYLNRLLNIKSHIILDKLTKKQNKRLERYFKSPPIKIIFTLTNGQQRIFYLTTLFKRFPGIEMKNNLFFFIKEETSTTFKILLQNNYSIFFKKL